MRFVALVVAGCFFGNMLMGAEGQDKSQLLKITAEEGYKFTPKVRGAFLSYAKAGALADLKKDGKSLPDEFLAWVDADPIVEGTVYAAHEKPSDMLLWLYSMRLDLGKEKSREISSARPNGKYRVIMR